MSTPDDIAEENRRLRRTMRDLVALSALPAVWTGLAPDGIARSLADVLLKTLSLDLAYFRLTDPAGAIVVEVVRTRQRTAAEAVRAAVAPVLSADRDAPTPTLPDPSGAGTLHVAVTRFSVGGDAGVLVTGSATPGYPTERDRLLLGVGANQTAIVVERRRAEERLREADRRKDEFLATLAHELRNPLAPIRNGLQILKRAGDPATLGQARGMMERQVEQMAHLIDDLMDVSRISRGKIVLQKTRMPVGQAVRDAVDTSRPLIDRQGHELVLDVPAEPVYVDGDGTRLTQVFANLLNNSAKYTDPGGRIRLAVERQGGEVVVSVADTGVGIPAPMLTRVFDLFSQVDRSLEQSQGGLGIGLNIVRKLVELHGGTIAAESGGAGAGSRFTVRLPAVAAPAGGPAPVPAGPAPHARRRILIVDDNRDGADSLAAMLGLLGNDTRTAHDGLEAVAAGEAFRPDVILMDIGMPRLNGFDACRRIRGLPWGAGVVLVACTGWGQDDDRRRSREAGFDLHMVKPVDPAALERLLAELKAAG